MAGSVMAGIRSSNTNSAAATAGGALFAGRDRACLEMGLYVHRLHPFVIQLQVLDFEGATQIVSELKMIAYLASDTMREPRRRLNRPRKGAQKGSED